MSHPENNPQNQTNSTTPPTSAPSTVFPDITSGYIGNPDYPLEFPSQLSEEEIAEIRQLSQYDSNNKAAPDNNMFFEELHNPLSSKGD